MEKERSKCRSSTAYETAHMKAKADEKNKEYEKWMEESSRSAEQPARKKV